MREIKFRAWNPENKYMTSGATLKNVCLKANHSYFYWDDAVIIMQYTGLKDKNGKDIYEGDIVGYNFWTSDTEAETGIAQVVFEVGAFMIDEWYLGITETEILGNIYTTPELLNK